MRITKPKPDYMKLFEIKPGEWTDEDEFKEQAWQRSVACAKVWEWHLSTILDRTYNSKTSLKVYTNQRNKYLGIKK